MSLEHLDTFIAFAVVMLGVSILITTLTQMISALFGYRGTNLRWGLTQLLKSVDPSLEAHAENIAQSVLTHPLISDSSVSKFARNFKTVPVLGSYLGRLHLASAIRVEELSGILQKMATPAGGAVAVGAGAGAGLAAAAAAGAGAQGAQGGGGAPVAAGNVAPAAVPLETAVGNLLARIDPGATRVIQPLVETIRELVPEGTQGANQLVDQIVNSAHRGVGSLEAWFNSAMDRVGQRFAMQMRIWTIVFAFLLAIAMHLDAFRLLSQLSSDAEMRASLVGSSDAMLKLSGQSTQIDQANLKNNTDQLADQARSVHDLLGKSRFQLFPDPYPKHWWDLTNDNPFGILTAAALLSLGAPFWFNALKTLSTLRPVLATNEKREQAQGTAA